MSYAPEPLVSCAGGCVKKLTEQQAEAAGWEKLPITGRMRCGTCTRELQAASKLGSTIEPPPTKEPPC